MEILNNPNKIKEIEDIKNSLKKFKNLTKNILEEIVFCMITGNEKNTIINLSKKNNLYYKKNLSNDILIDRKQNIYTYKTIGFSNIYQTLVQPRTLQHYYLSNNINNINYINYISNIPIEWIIVLDPLYFNKDFKEQLIVDNKLYFNEEISYLENIVCNKSSLYKQYWQTKILQDIYNNIRENIKNKL